MRLVGKLLDEQWRFVKWIEGWSEDEILLYLPKDFKGHVLIYENGKVIKQYDVK